MPDWIVYLMALAVAGFIGLLGILYLAQLTERGK